MYTHVLRPSLPPVFYPMQHTSTNGEGPEDLVTCMTADRQGLARHMVDLTFHLVNIVASNPLKDDRKNGLAILHLAPYICKGAR